MRFLILAHIFGVVGSQPLKEEPPLAWACRDKFLVDVAAITSGQEGLTAHDVVGTSQYFPIPTAQTFLAFSSKARKENINVNASSSG